MTVRIPQGPEISRRGLLGGMGGLSFCVALGAGGRVFAAEPAEPAAGASELSAWVSIAPDGATRIYSAGAEMGQGSLTALAAILAEEMDADWSRVTVEFAPSDVETYGYPNGDERSMAIVGSRAVMKYYDTLRQAGAQVRKALVQAAAEEWGVDAAALRTEPGAVVDPASGRRLDYGEIASRATMPAELPEVAPEELKSRADFRIIGKDVPRVDVPLKVNGTAQFAIDVKLPGMVYATTVHSPVQNGAPKRWNAGEIEAMPGVVKTVGLPNGVAIVAESFPEALEARWALDVEWEAGGRSAATPTARSRTRRARSPASTAPIWATMARWSR